MAAQGPTAVTASKQQQQQQQQSQSQSSACSSAGNLSTTTTTGQLAPHPEPPAAPPPPLRPPRAHANSNLVQPKHALQPPPSTTTGGGGGGAVVGVRKSTCAKCTNISIMQLFYEMKQKFPTVSDDVVNESVLENCHERQRLMAVLQAHSESSQTLIPSTYPSKALRGSVENVLGTKKKCAEEGDRETQSNTIPRRSKGVTGTVGAALVAAAVPLVGMVSGTNLLNGSSGGGGNRRQSDTNNPKHQGSSDMLSNGGNFLSNNIQRMATGGAAAAAAAANMNNKVERPCTLNLSPITGRPLRAAPPIPSTTSSTSSLSSLSTATDLQSASSPILTASNESINVSVNVTLSPILTPRSTATTMGGSHVAKPPIPPRHTTELTVQPEILPFHTTTPTRSFTSVNFTLRQPLEGAAGGTGAAGGGDGGTGSAAGFPIDITTAGSSMTYSSSSYNAKAGYQSQLQITVGNGGGSISAIRTVAPTAVVTPSGATTVASSLMRGSRGLLEAGSGLDADSEEVLINRQLQSKWKLKTELDKYRKRLDVMQRDIKVLETPLPASAPDQLQEQINQLRTVCDSMAAAVEQAGNFALGETNEAFYQRLDSQSGGSAGGSPATPRPSNATPTTIPGSPAAANRSRTVTATVGTPEGRTSQQAATSASVASEELEPEGWTCSQCTFQNHPELNMCEQCGMVKRQQQMNRPLLHQQQQQQPPGIVQITSSQFIPAAGVAAANPNPAQFAVMPANVNMSPYMMPGYHLPTTQPQPRMIYTSPMCQYPPPFSYPAAHMTPPTPPVTGFNGVGGGGGASPGMALGHVHTPPPPAVASGSSSTRSAKSKKGSKFNSKFSQSISNLFSSSTSSSATSSNSHANSQE